MAEEDGYDWGGAQWVGNRSTTIGTYRRGIIQGGACAPGSATYEEDDVPQSKHAYVVAPENCTKKKTSVAVSQSKKLGEVQEIYKKLEIKA